MIPKRKMVMAKCFSEFSVSERQGQCEDEKGFVRKREKPFS